MLQSASTITAMLFCMVYLVYKLRRKEDAELLDYVKCALSGTVIPHLIYCLYILTINPLDIYKLQGCIQYLGLGAMVILFVSFSNLAKVFSSTPSP